MVTERLEVRLDAERRRKLCELAASRHASLSQFLRQVIDELYERSDLERRLQAAQALAAMEIEDVPDPATLKRQLVSTHDTCLP